MEPILDETSLVPFDQSSPAARILIMAESLRALDQRGAARTLRSVRNAADRDIGSGRGLRAWCFDRSTDRDAGRLVASRLGRQPFVDGEHGLFAAAEGKRAVEAMLDGKVVLGLGLAALNRALSCALIGEGARSGGIKQVDLLYLDDQDEDVTPTERVEVLVVVTRNDVGKFLGLIDEIIDSSVADGKDLLARAGSLYPRLVFAPKALEQVAALTGRERVFRQLQRHLRALDRGAAAWCPGTRYCPEGSISWSFESRATLTDGKLGAMRDFPYPPGFERERWSHHTKLTGGAEVRLYFKPAPKGSGLVVLIGYIGPKLSTTRYKT